MIIMYNSPITITGRIVDAPAYHNVKGNTDGVLRIRVASSRSYYKDGKWNNVDKLFINVEAWGKLGVNAHKALLKGTAIIVQGLLYTNEWEFQSAQENPEGKAVNRQEVRLRATSIGVDMNYYKVGYKDARPPLESNLDEVDYIENTDNTYPSFDGGNQSEAGDSQDSEEQERELVSAGAPGGDDSEHS